MKTKKKYKTYEQARDWARESGIKTSKEWFKAYELGKIPFDIPKHPCRIYGKSG